MDPSTTYNAGKLGGHGNDYQRQLAWILLQRAMLQKGCDFKMAFEMEDAGKFDDVGLFLNGVWYLIQTKHSQPGGSMKKITQETLYEGGDGDFALLKYLKSFAKMKWIHGKIGKIILFTNRDLEYSKFDASSWSEADLDDFSRFFKFSRGKHLKLIKEDTMIAALRDEAFKRDLSAIRDALIVFFKTEQMSLILKEYHCYLKKLLVIDNQKVRLLNQHKNPTIKQLYNDLVKVLGKDFIKNMSIDPSVMGDFWTNNQDLVKTNINRKTVREFLSKLVLSVAQPNVEQLKREMINEGRLWMRTWIRPDDFGRLDTSAYELPWAILKREFDMYENPLVNAAGKKQTTKEFLQRKNGEDILSTIKEKLHQQVQKVCKRSCVSLEAIENYYINRQMCNVSNSSKISDVKFVDELYKSLKEHKCFVLTAQPGMGKSTLWQYLAFKAQKVHSDKAVFLIYLNNLPEEIPKIKQICDIFSTNIFKYVLSSENIKTLIEDDKTQIILHLDAYDELSEQGQTNALQLIKVLLNKPNIKIIISGRRHVKEKLVNNLNAVPLELQTFDYEEQMKFLEKFWTKSVKNPDRFKKFAKKILEKIHSNISRKEYDFTGIPLMIRMVAEIFVGPFESYLNSEIDLNKIVSMEKISLLDLYELFARKCIQITMNKKYNVDNNRVPDSIFNSTMKSLDYDYQVLAVELLFSDELHPFIKNRKFREVSNTLGNRIENQQSLIVEKFAGNAKFTHLSFAEYFAAKYLFEYCGRKEAQLCNYEILENLKSLKIVRIFFLAMIDAKIIASTNNIRACFKRLEQPDQNRLQLLKEMGFEIVVWACKRDYCNILKYLHILHDPFYLENVRYTKAKSLLQISFEKSALKVDKFLIETFTNKVTCKYPLHFAVESNRLDVVKQIISTTESDINLPDDAGSTPIFRAKSFEMFKYLLEKGAHLDVRNKSNKTVLRFVPFCIELESLEDLFEQKDLNGFRMTSLINRQDLKGNSTFHFVCKSGNIRMVEVFVKNYADVNLKNLTGDTPLDIAITKFHFNVVKFLLRECEAFSKFFKMGMSDFLLKHASNIYNFTTFKNAIQTCLLLEMNVNSKFFGYTALHIAARYGCRETIEILCKTGAEINTQNIRGETPLHVAVAVRAFEIVQFLISQGSNLNLIDIDGNTVLHIAAEYCNEDIISLLIDAFTSSSISLNSENSKGKSALLLAFERGKDFNFHHFIEAGADLNAFYSKTIPGVQGSREISELLLFDNFSSKTILCMLEKTDKSLLTDPNLLCVAAHVGYEKSVQILIDAGLNVNAKCSIDRSHRKHLPKYKSKSALHIAAFRGHNTIVKQLIHFKADINFRDDKGQTPLHQCNSKETYDLLVREGADESLKDIDGNTGLHIAARDNSFEVVEYLLSKRSTDVVNCGNDTGKTALHFASMNGNENIVELLVQNNAIINSKDYSGKTPIFYAVEEGQTSIVRCLIKHSAEIDLKDYRGMIFQAARLWPPNQLVSLLEIGVDPNEVDESEISALHYAVKFDTELAADLLVKAGADVNLLDKSGSYPLNYAAYCRSLHADTIGILTDYTTDIDHKNCFGESPLHTAIKSIFTLDYTKLYRTRLFIAKGASIHLADRDGNTPLHLAILKDNSELINLFVNLLTPSEMNMPNSKGETPLHLAVLRNNVSLVETLIRKGVNINLNTIQKKTALDLALEQNYFDIVTVLNQNNQNNQLQ